MDAKKRCVFLPSRHFALQTYLYLAATILFATVLLSGALIHFQQRMLRRQMQEKGTTVVSFLAESLRLGLFSENAEEIRSALLPALRDDDVEWVAVFDPSWRLLQYGRNLPGAPTEAKGQVPAPSAEVRAIVAQPGGIAHHEDAENITFWKAVRAELSAPTVEGLYFFTGPLGQPASGTVLGYVGVEVSKRALEAGFRAIVVRSVGAGVAFLVLGWCVTFLVVRGASRPLRRLLNEMRRRGIWTETPASRGLLADPFYELVQALDRAFVTIDELRLGLEERVRERTAELTEANQRLQDEVQERTRVQEELKRARDELEERVKERTEELETAYKQLAHSEKLTALGTLTASVAHELNNPLTGIRGVLESLEYRGGLSARETRLVKLAIQECDRIDRLIKNLRDFYRPTTDRTEDLDVNELVDSVVLLCTKDLMVRGIEVKTSFAKDLPRVRGVGDQLKQVVLNLITNARDAMPSGGTLRVATEASEGWVKIHVEDTGGGIEEKDLEHIFRPFFSTKTAGEGTGLGLSISRGIIKRHRGDIEVVSRVGEGTRCTVSLPASDPAQDGKPDGGSEAVRGTADSG
ncbi:sensor histidine kinase [Deferrisoma camini]|uniref:sensor histidine kinase n=1 Tax=Deferrisoma camini TaxID=1035120 RepID=UPI00046CA7CA|nr:ATP-binding protein [Deferrisoma camini]